MDGLIEPGKSDRGKFPVLGALILGTILATVLLGKFLTRSTSTEPSVANLRFVVNVNKATQAELRTLPDVGPTLAMRIVEYRDLHGPFSSIEQLTEVRGFGPKTLEKLAPMLVLTNATDRTNDLNETERLASAP